jgi:FMN-dependent NADH-azoreductase
VGDEMRMSARLRWYDPSPWTHPPKEDVMQLLHVVATPRAADSRTLRISYPFLESFRAECPDAQIETLDLFTRDLPALDGTNIDVKYNLMSGRPISPGYAESWQHIEELINQFMRADVCVISTPMWNFGIPYVLKYYIDVIVQPRYLFEYDAAGIPVGRCQGKRMVCITTRGSDYSVGGPMHAFDLQEGYLRAIFGFVGITDIEFINAQPIDMGPERREAAITASIETAQRLATKLGSQTV